MKTNIHKFIFFVVSILSLGANVSVDATSREMLGQPEYSSTKFSVSFTTKPIASAVCSFLDTFMKTEKEVMDTLRSSLLDDQKINKLWDLAARLDTLYCPIIISGRSRIDKVSGLTEAELMFFGKFVALIERSDAKKLEQHFTIEVEGSDLSSSSCMQMTVPQVMVRYSRALSRLQNTIHGMFDFPGVIGVADKYRWTLGKFRSKTHDDDDITFLKTVDSTAKNQYS